MNTFNRINLYMQLAMSLCMIAFGIFNTIRCFAGHSSIVYILVFAAIAYIGYRMMLLTIDELRNEKGGQL